MYTPTIPSRRFLLCCLLACTPLCGQAASSYATTFANDADYDNHFVELSPSGSATLGLESYDSSERGLRKRGSGVQSVIFDSGATGGIGGGGGTYGSKNDAALSRTSLKADLRFLNFNAASMGFWTHVAPSYQSGYLADFTIISSTTVRLRVYDSNSNPAGNTVGTNLLNQTLSVPAGVTLNTSSFYSGALKVTPTSTGGLRFELSFTTTDGTPLATATVEDTTAPMTAPGQVGLRFSSENLLLDNFGFTSSSIINIQAAPFLARGDGIADNRPAFAAAFAALAPGDTLLVPRGTYRIALNASVLVQPPETTLLGETDHTIIKLQNGDSTAARQFLRPGGDNIRIEGITFERAANFPLTFFPLYHSSNPRGITFRNCTIVGNRDLYTTYYSHGFETGYNTVADVLLENLLVTTCSYGLFGASAATGSLDGITVRNSRFYRNYATDLEFNTPNGHLANVLVADCHFLENQAVAATAGWAVGLAEIHNATIQDCFIRDYGRAGIHVEDHSENVLITGNMLTNTATIGDNPVIILSASDGVSVDRNVIDARGNPRSGVHLVLVTAGGANFTVPTNVSVTGNILVNGAGTTTWYLQPGSGPAPTGNIIAP